MKLSPVTILVIGASIGVIALAFGFFWHWVPNNRERQMWAEYEANLQRVADMRPRAIAKVEKAEELIEEKALQWREVVATRTPPASVAAGGVNVSVNAWQLTVDARTFRNNVQRRVNAQVRSGGVRVLSGPSVPLPSDNATDIMLSYFNYPAIPFPVVIYDLGAVQVQGTYDQITANVRAWSRMPRFLAVADGLTLQGTSPLLTGTYNLTIVGFIRGDDIFPPVPEGGVTMVGATPGAPPPGGAGGPSGMEMGGGAGADQADR
jgi:hypothetical protein